MPQRPSLDEIFASPVIAAPVAAATARPSLSEIFGQPQQPAQPDTSKGESMLAGISQGASFNLGDEALAGLTAAGAYGVSKGLNAVGVDTKGLSDKTYGELYTAEKQKSAEQLKQAREQNPLSYMGGEVAGAFGLGGGVAGTKAAQALGRGLSGGAILGRNLGIAGRVAKGAAAGASAAGVSGFGAGEGLENSIQSGIDSMGTGAALGAAIPVVGAVAGKLASGAKSLVPVEAKSVSTLRSQAAPLYDKFTNSGGVYSNKLTNEIADLADAAKSQGIAGSTKKADDALNDALDFYSSLRGKELSPTDLQKLDQSLADDIGRFNKAGEYNFGRILNNLKYEMRDRAFDPTKAAGYIKSGDASAVEALKEANRLYAQSYKAADVEKILSKAKGTENPQTSIRTNLKNLLSNDNKMKSYTPQEKAILEEALDRGVAGGAVKLLGGRLIDSLLGGGVGFAAGGPIGGIAGAVAGKAVGGVAAEAAGAIQANRLRGALKQIQGGATPVVQAPSKLPIVSGGAGALVGGETSMAVPIAQTSIQTPAQQPAQPQPTPQTNYIQKLIKLESGGNPNAKAKTSSAEGLTQFTDGTWRAMVSKYGQEYGLTANGRTDPEQATIAAELYAKENSDKLARTLGREPEEHELYIAHFMGGSGAKKLLTLPDNTNAAQVFPEAAKANKPIFLDRGKARTVGQVKELIKRKFEDA